MGYTLIIGQAVPEVAEDGFGWTVQYATDPAAPDTPDCHQLNSRSPCYTVWADFARSTGLIDLFPERSGGGFPALIRRHPGIVPLHQYHRIRIDEAYAVLLERHPAAIPRFSSLPLTHPDPGSDIGPMDAHLARLVWLRFWVGWALDNCTHPAFENA